MNRQTSASQTKQTTLPICIGCSSDALGIERTLKNNPGILKVYANPVTEMLYVEFDPALIDQDKIITVIKRGGFGLVTKKRDYVFDKSAASG
jgi:copper chaperone CopZ